MFATKHLSLVLVVLAIAFANTTIGLAQLKNDEPSKLDVSLETALKAVKSRNWEVALGELATARRLQDKESYSEFLFQNIELADEDRNPANLSSDEKQITLWRHAMGARQAIRTFQAYTSALAGRHADAAKYSDEVYKTQSVVWGLSWRAFNPPVYDLFLKYVQPEKTEGYGRFLYISGDLLSASDDDRWKKLIEEAQKYLPKDADLAATLAGVYIMSDRTADAKKQAELSLSLKPGQARVYIDLANAEWMLGNVQVAKKHAHEAKKLRPDLPGPNATLAFVAIEEGDLKAAKEFAEEGSRISEKHKFYQTVLAAYEVAAGNASKARSIMNEAWGSDQPTPEMLKSWFFRRKPLENILSLRK